MRRHAGQAPRRPLARTARRQRPARGPPRAAVRRPVADPRPDDGRLPPAPHRAPHGAPRRPAARATADRGPGIPPLQRRDPRGPGRTQGLAPTLGRAMFPLLLVLFIVVPIIEIFAIITVGQAIGVWWTIALLIADSILGAWLMRSQGRAAWRRFNATLAEGRAPAREVLDGVLVIFGGALLLTPGLVTDVFGALFLIPPPRAVLRRVLVHRFAARMIVSAPPGFGPRRPTRGDADVEGTASEVDPKTLRCAPTPTRPRAAVAATRSATRSPCPSATPRPTSTAWRAWAWRAAAPAAW